MRPAPGQDSSTTNSQPASCNNRSSHYSTENSPQPPTAAESQPTAQPNVRYSPPGSENQDEQAPPSDRVLSHSARRDSNNNATAVQGSTTETPPVRPLHQQSQGSSVSSSAPHHHQATGSAPAFQATASIDDVQLEEIEVDAASTPTPKRRPPTALAPETPQPKQGISSAETNVSIASTNPRMTTDDRPLLTGTTPPASSAVSGQQQQQTDRTPPYGSVAHPGLTDYPYCVAIVNPASGERSAAQFVFNSLCDELGPERVLRLDGAVFRNPAPIRLLVEKALRSDGGDRDRGTVIVSGGDGTVAFVMAQLDAIAEQYGVQHDSDSYGNEQPMTPEARHEEDERLLGMHPAPHAQGGLERPRSSTVKMPAVGVLALGTGNDFSNCMGFGAGYTKRPCCCMCVCCVNHVHSIMKDIINSPAIPFDRWVATIAPADDTPTSPVPSKTSIFMNYFSLGMDAFIATKFDSLRREHPSCFQYRFQNKGWYGALGLYGTMNCNRLNKSVPKIAFYTDPKKQKSSNSATDNQQQQQLSTVLPPKTKALVLSNVDSYSGGTKLWADGNKGAKYCMTSTPSSVSINDHLLEVQGLGGLIDMTMLQMKIGNGADKIGQVRECEIMVSASKKEPVPVQADGEPMGSLTHPTKIGVKRYEKVVYVRCRRSEVDTTASVGLTLRK